VELLAVGTADRWMIAGVAGFAVRDRARVVFGSVGLRTDSTSVAISSATLGRMSIELVFVAASGRSKGDIFSNLAFTVEDSKAFSTERLLGDLPNESDNHRRRLFILTTFWTGEPSRCLSHWKYRVCRLDFSTDGIGVSSSRDSMDNQM
jgi:hypothetical protein